MNILTMICAEPYRLFFPLGWVMGAIGVAYWALVAAGLTLSYNPLYHGLIQIELFCSAFAVGFLLTALPKFLRSRAATNAEIAWFLSVYVVLVSATLSNALIISQWIFIFFILLLVRFAGIKVRERKAMPPFSFFLVAFGLFEGIVGAFLIIYPFSIFPLLGQKLLEQGMFLSLSLGVGSFLGPRLMGVVDTANAIVSLPGRADRSVPWRKSPGLIVCVIGGLIFLSFLIETGWNREIGMYLRGATAFFCLARFDVLKIPRSRSITGILVALSLWSMPVGILLAAVLPMHEVGMLHLMYIGGFGMLILTIGAQVISSHGGIPQFWQMYRRSAVLIASLIVISTLCRMSASLFPKYYFSLLGIAAVSFDIALMIWGIGVIRYIGSKVERVQGGAALSVQR